MTPPNLTNPPSRLGPKQMHTKQVRRSSRQRCAKTKTNQSTKANQKTNQKTKVQDRWFYETVPALTDPALTDPGLTVPALTVPALTVPAPAIDDAIDEDWELYYPIWEIHKHPGAWDYFKLDSTQEALRQCSRNGTIMRAYNINS